MRFYTRPSADFVNRYPIPFWYIHAIAIIFTFQSLLVAYVSSSYLEQFVSSTTVGLLYSVASLGSILCFFVLPSLLRLCGNFLITIGSMLGCIIALYFLGLAPNAAVTIAAFIVFNALNPLLYLHVDIFSEALLDTKKQEDSTGEKRGLTLSLMSVAALAAPLTVSALVTTTSELSALFFLGIYIGAAFIAAVIYGFRHFYDSPYNNVNVWAALCRLPENTDITLVTASHFLLQLFFSWAIIYIPLYWATEIGLNWTEIGFIIAAGLSAYVFFEYPFGIIADRYWGEVEMMTIGFALVTVTVGAISFIGTANILVWMLLMFINRVAASMIEVTTESYFFKSVHGGDAGLITIFRLTRPAANLAGAMLGTVTLIFVPFQFAFIVLAAFMALGMFLSAAITDTK